MRLTMRAEIGPPLAERLPLRSGLARELPRLASDLARGVRDRTLDGRDVAGRTFPPKADGSPSTLRDTGAMVESFRPERLDKRGFVLAPASRAERRRAALHQLGRGVPERRWVGLDARQVDEAVEAVATAETGKDRQ